MARGSSLGVMLEALRLELRRSSNVAISQDDTPHLRRVITRVYEQLYDEHDWPQLRKVFPRTALAATQRYYDFPTGLNPERVETVHVWYGGVPHILERGIGVHEYASYDSESGDTANPALRWDIRWDGDGASGTAQFEIWPVPAGNDMEIEFIGIQSVDRLVDDADICHLDDNMIVLFAAAQLLAAQKSEDAEFVAQQAAARFEQMKKRISSAGDRRYRLGLGHADKDHPRSRAIVRVG